MAFVQGSYNYQVPYYWDSVVGPLPLKTLWETCPTPAEVSDPSGYYTYKEEFDKLTIASNTFGGWIFTSVTSGSVTQDTTNTGGIIKLDAGAVTANQGVNFQLNNFPLAVAAGKPVWFEARVKWTGLTSLKVQAFVGLAVSSTAVIASGAVADIDRIGFQGVTTTGAIASVTHSGSTNVTTGTGFTIVNNTWTKIGFYAQTTGVQFWQDGVILGTITTNIPTAALAPTLVNQANATVQSVLNVDYVKAFGYR